MKLESRLRALPLPRAAAAATATALALTALSAVGDGGTAHAAAYESSPVGYGAGTTGGGSAAATTVTTASAFQAAVTGSTAKVVRVSGMITLSDRVDVGSNTTVIGVGSGSGFTGAGLRVKGQKNVVIRNLVITKSVAPNDAIEIQNSTYVWVDHNDLSSDRSHDKDYYDGLVDINHGSDYVSVSWNKIHDHWKTSLVGHSDNNASEDTGHLRVTYSHNWFYNVTSRLPSLRFGKGHMLNNYFQNVSDSGVHARMSAEIYVENNVFNSVKNAVFTDDDGAVNQSGNTYTDSTTAITRTTSFKPSYSYSAEAASTVAATVSAGAGTGRVG